MLTVGQHIDRYIVEGKLGEGGMAEVYRVRHETLHTAHALKVLTLTDTGVRERLVREGRMQANLMHENIVQVTDVLSIGGQPGLLMEFVEGPTLEQWLNRYRPPITEIEIVFRAICTGVGVAHHRGLIHRDLKPSNVLLAVVDDRIVPKVADFGLARQVDTDSSRHTRTGSTMGTPGYMPPEQIRDASSVDRRGDLWSLGCILYRMATGVPAFDGDDLIELFTQVASADYIPSRKIRPELPERIHAIVDRALRVNLAERISDCASLIEYLDGKRAELDLQFTPKARNPSSERPRAIWNSPEALGVAKSIVEETLSGLPKLDRNQKKPPSPKESLQQAEQDFFLAEDVPLRPPVGIRAAAEQASAAQQITGETLSPDARPRGIGAWLFAGTMIAAVVALITIAVGSVGIWYVLIPPKPSTSVAGIIEPKPPAPVKLVPKPVEPDPPSLPLAPPDPEPQIEQPRPAEPKSVEPKGPEEPPAPAQGTSPGQVSYSGAEALWLEGPSGAVRDLEHVPPGRYKVLAVFGDTGVVVANMGVTIQPGKRSVLTCVAAFAQCKEK